jgi:hypothetical protein
VGSFVYGSASPPLASHRLWEIGDIVDVLEAWEVRN